jgi:hypothetical protein
MSINCEEMIDCPVVYRYRNNINLSSTFLKCFVEAKEREDKRVCPSCMERNSLGYSCPSPLKEFYLTQGKIIVVATVGTCSYDAKPVKPRAQDV